MTLGKEEHTDNIVYQTQASQGIFGKEKKRFQMEKYNSRFNQYNIQNTCQIPYKLLITYIHVYTHL